MSLEALYGLRKPVRKASAAPGELMLERAMVAGPDVPPGLLRGTLKSSRMRPVADLAHFSQPLARAWFRNNDLSGGGHEDGAGDATPSRMNSPGEAE